MRSGTLEVLDDRRRIRCRDGFVQAAALQGAGNQGDGGSQGAGNVGQDDRRLDHFACQQINLAGSGLLDDGRTLGDGGTTQQQTDG